MANTSEVRVSFFKKLTTWPFWRNMVVYFCFFSVLGHLIEWPYVWLGATFFNSVPLDAEILTNPLKPFMVYGFGIVACIILLVPFKIWLVERFGKVIPAFIVFYIVAVFAGMCMELIQGFLQNQPVDGVYPLWDVHDYPGNILGQAWIVNDLGFGAIMALAVWHVYPMCEKQLAKLTEKQANINVVIVVAVFIALILLTYF